MENTYAILILILAVIGGVPFAVLYLQERDVFSPIGFVALGYLIVIFGPALDYSFNGTREILFNEPLSYLITPLLLIILSILLFILGYVSSIGDVIASQTPQPFTYWHSKRAIGTAVLFAIIGIFSYAAFVATTGGIPSTLAELSRQRRPPTEYLRWGVSFLYISSLIYWATILNEGWSITSLKSLSVFPIFIISITFPIYASSRSSLVWLLGTHLLVFHYHRQYFSARFFLALSPMFLLATSALYIMRVTGKATLSTVLSPNFALEGVIGARPNGLTAIAHIYHLTGEELPYLGGSSLIHFLIFPIPRAIWGNKPMNVAQYLGEELYSQGVGIIGGGTPPTIIGELWLNAGLPLVIIGMFFFGVIAKWGYLYFNPLQTENPLCILLYAGFAVEICHRVFMNQLTLGILGFLMWAIPLFFAGFLISFPNLLKRYRQVD